ncbi:hypothetical protein P7C73_g6268, partial [Tremellales sp. Uapishka_1]
MYAIGGQSSSAVFDRLATQSASSNCILPISGLPPLPDSPCNSLDSLSYAESPGNDHIDLPKKLLRPQHLTVSPEKVDDFDLKDDSRIFRAPLPSSHSSRQSPYKSVRPFASRSPVKQHTLRGPESIPQSPHKSAFDVSPTQYKRVSPTPASIPLPPSPVKSVLVPCPCSPPTVNLSSFQLPTNIAETSMIGDCSYLGGSSIGDGSLDFGIREMRPKGLPGLEDLGYMREMAGGSATPTRAGVVAKVSHTPTTKDFAASRLQPSLAMQNLKASTLLPSSPGKAHLLASTNAISRVAPPWESSVSDISGSCELPPRRTRYSPSKSQQRPVSPSTVAKSKRTFPASSSGASLASLEEDPELNHAGEVSTLLPQSPEKIRHLLRDEEMITREVLIEDPSMRVELPKGTPRAKSRSPRKRKGDVNLGGGDMTMDVKDMMARMSKPKRSSGTEESFADLLNDDLELSMVDPDESFLPSTLRPTRFPASSSGRSLASIGEERGALPSSLSGRSLSSVNEERRGLPSSSSVQSLTGMAQKPRGLPSSSSASSLSSARDGDTRTSRERTQSIEALLSRIRNPTIPQSVHKSHERTSSMSKERVEEILRTVRKAPAADAPSGQQSVGRSSRRISLSVGAVPLPSSASITTLDLPSDSQQASGYDSKSSSASSRTVTASRDFGAATTIGQPKTRVSLAPQPKSRSGSTSSSVSISASIPSLPRSRSHVAQPSSNRAGSSSSTVSSAASVPFLPSSRLTATASSKPLTRPTTTVRPGAATSQTSKIVPTASSSFRPASTAAVPTSSRIAAAVRTAGANAPSSARTTTSSRPPVPSRPALLRPTGLPLPGQSSSARSADFGRDSTAPNRPKMSSGPTVSPLKRATEVTMKSRAGSTPASVISRAGQGSAIRKPSVPPVPTGLPRPASRIPASGASLGKTSSTSASISDLRARMERLQSRSAVGRAGK